MGRPKKPHALGDVLAWADLPKHRMEAPSPSNTYMLASTYRRLVVACLDIPRVPGAKTLMAWVTKGFLQGTTVVPHTPTSSMPTEPGVGVVMVLDSEENRDHVVRLVTKGTRGPAPSWQQRVYLMVAEQMVPFVTRERLLETHLTQARSGRMVLNLSGLFFLGTLLDTGELPARLYKYADLLLRREIAAHLSEYGYRNVYIRRAGWHNGVLKTPAAPVYTGATRSLRHLRGGRYEIRENRNVISAKPVTIAAIAIGIQQNIAAAEYQRRKERRLRKMHRRLRD